MRGTMAILEMKNICKSFAGVYANENINLSVEKGEIHALLGENGAGKTTLMNILFGIYTADSGEIFWKGSPAAFDSPKDAIAAGIGMVHQHFSLVRKMTVLDNMILGMKENGLFLDRKALREKMVALAKRYGLAIDPDARILDLSVGQQQRVEILKALFRNVELLILDEPTGVLTPEETSHFFDVLRNLKKEGYAIIIITHRMSEIMAISDRVTILRDGRQVKSLVTAETNPAELSHYMIGRELTSDYEIREGQGDAVSLELQNVTLHQKHKRNALDKVSLQVKAGEILGIAGVDGNGQKELAEVITGIRRHDEGTVLFYGKDIGKQHVRERFQEGIVYISDDRLADGLVTDMNITDNLMLREYGRKPFSNKGFLNRKAMAAHAEEKVKLYQVKASGTTGINTAVKLMSGGNQQKVIIARELTEEAKLIVANQPTRGLDIGATEFVRKMLVEQRNAGKSVILISADLEEILSLSDRIAVLFGGQVAGVVEQKDATVDKLGLLMGGIVEEMA